jgi:hypothetical protein
MFSQRIVHLLGLLIFTIVALPLHAQAPEGDASAAEKTVEVNRAAKVVVVEGSVNAFSPATQKRALRVGDVLSEGDGIVTGKDGELHLEMDDGGYLAVRPNTKMRIAKFQAKGEPTDTGVFRLLEGSFRSVTGWIGKFNRDKYLVRTPTATIGIRGIDHEPFVIPKGSSEGEPGTYDKVNEGGSFIRTPRGRADIAPNQAGFVSLDKAAAPRLLKDIPAHFRPTRNEGLLKGKHAEVQSHIEERCEARRKEIAQGVNQGKANAAQRREQRQEEAKKKREEALQQKAEARKAREDARKAKLKKKAIDEDTKVEARAPHAGRK